MNEMIPSSDPQRLAALESYEILDTPAESSFDLVTTTVSQMLQVPHCCVSLVDRERVWFKSAAGVDVSEVKRELGFCSTLVISDEEIRHIEDARSHPETENNSLVCGAARCPILCWSAAVYRGWASHRDALRLRP